jgi:probable phosphoglycerate mutase
MPKPVRIVIFRHGPTAWNEEGRFQGHTDVPLSDKGRAEMSRCRLPDEFQKWPVISSPLSRAAETARLVTRQEPELDRRLIEMKMGEWEGQLLTEIRDEMGVLANSYNGLDYRCHGGESLRDVQQRLKPWIAEIYRRGENSVVVSHKGTLSALYAWAAKWDVQGHPPDRVDWKCFHVLVVESNTEIKIEKLNQAFFRPL